MEDFTRQQEFIFKNSPRQQFFARKSREVFTFRTEPRDTSLLEGNSHFGTQESFLPNFKSSYLESSVYFETQRKLFNMDKPIPKKSLGSFLPSLSFAPPEKHETIDRTNSVQYTLQVVANANSKTNTYKLVVQRFQEGSPNQYISLLDSIYEVWEQNSIVAADDRTAVVRSLLREQSLITYDTAVLELQEPDAQGNSLPFDIDLIYLALDALATSVFPHRALEMQKTWMRRTMKKPRDLNIRSYATGVAKMNNALPFFPGAKDTDKFTATELVELLEWSVPAKWRVQFDKEHYIPTHYDRATFIERCETLERTDPDDSSKNIKDKNSGLKSKKAKHTPAQSSSDGAKQKYCTHHGKNTTHNTGQCFALKKKAEAPSGKPPFKKGKPFNDKYIRKEIHTIAKVSKKSRKKVIDRYINVLHKEKSKLSKIKKKASKKKPASSSSSSASSSDSDMSHGQIDQVVEFNKNKVSFAKKLAKKRTFQVSNPTPQEDGEVMTTESIEEESFQERISHLGKSDNDAPSDEDKK